ncbi:MAG TPA: phosphopentomutase [Bacillota bacterium]|nr:phosphopentomutase [Bacillota bacterium]
MKPTIILLVLDSVGIGALPDAAEFGDESSNTLGHVLDANPELELPNLAQLGMGLIMPHERLAVPDAPMAHFGRGMTLTKAKDTISGHWEMMGVVQAVPFQTFPKGFPPHIVQELVKRTGREYLGNKVASGTEIIAELGEEHVRTGSPILYTSADSVLQIAAHEDVVPLPELYEICLAARDIMRNECNVARIIARPFVGVHPYARTPNRRDYAVSSPRPTALDMIHAHGLTTVGIGKICDIFAHSGLSECVKTLSNSDGMAKTQAVYARTPEGLIFTNLVDFDSHYGHRNDTAGYGNALREVDVWLGEFLPTMRDRDWLLVVADHGCDPAFPGTDHTREYVPILAYSPGSTPGGTLGDRASLTDIGATILRLLGHEHDFPAQPFDRELEG